MGKLRKVSACIVTVALAIAAVASLALALLTVVDDLRRRPSTPPLDVNAEDGPLVSFRTPAVLR